MSFRSCEQCTHASSDLCYFSWLFFLRLLGEAPNQFQTTRLNAGRDYSLIKAPTRILHTPSPLDRTSLTTTFYAPSVVSPRLRDLAPETNQTRAQGFLSSTIWLSGVLVTETEVAKNQGESGWFQHKILGDTSGDASQRMIRLGLTSTAGSIRYGILSRSAGQAFLQVPTRHGVRCGENGHPDRLRCGARSGNNGTM